MRPPRILLPVLALPFLAGIACSSSTQPQSLPTLLVRNATCDAGPCATLEVRAFVWGFAVPQPLFGSRVLGEVHSASGCLTFPSSWTLRVIGVDSAGRRDTTITTWTPDTPNGIYLVAVDSTVFYGDSAQRANWYSQREAWPYDAFAVGSVGETRTFVPGKASGWSVTFPSTLVSGGRAPELTQAQPCRP
jgi:hypothetical protein